MKEKICYVCSSGGHFDEMNHVRKEMEEIDSFLVTEKTQIPGLTQYDDVYCVSRLSRKDAFWIFKMLKLFVQGVSIFLKEKPTHIISFGAMVTYPFCLVGKLMGKKVIYVESVARVNSPSLTGKLVYPFADLFVVQWEQLLDVYPNAVYGGWVYE